MYLSMYLSPGISQGWREWRIPGSWLWVFTRVLWFTLLMRTMNENPTTPIPTKDGQFGVKFPWEFGLQPCVIQKCCFSCSLTMSQFSLGVASNQLVLGGERNPLGNLFVRTQHWNTSHEDTVKEERDISWQCPAEKAQGVFLRGWSSRHVMNEAVALQRSPDSTTCCLLISALSYLAQHPASAQHCRKSALPSCFCFFFHNRVCLCVAHSLFHLVLEELSVLSSRCWAKSTVQLQSSWDSVSVLYFYFTSYDFFSWLFKSDFQAELKGKKKQHPTWKTPNPSN